MSESNEIKNEEAPRRKKNIIRVYHAQNASDAGRRKREPGEKRSQRPGQGRPRPGAARPAAAGERRTARPGQAPAAEAKPARVQGAPQPAEETSAVKPKTEAAVQ